MSEIAVARPAEQAKAAHAVPTWVTMGVLFGLLSAAAIALFGPIGVSTTYPRFVGEFLKVLTPGAASSNPYLAKVGGLLKPETMLVIGLFIGGYLARRLSGERKAPALEHVHNEEKNIGRRYLNAFLGGVLIIFGARLAGGCTSGHIISGITQLALSGMLFAAGVFGMGIVTARLMKGGH